MLLPEASRVLTNSLQRQVREGIDAVIVDNVLAIRKGLTKDEARAAETKAEGAPSELTEPSGVLVDEASKCRATVAA